jgi:putative oxidoreductase
VSQLWLSRKGFWVSDGGLEFPLCWTVMLVVQALLGGGAFALKVPALPWERTPQRAAA